MRQPLIDTAKNSASFKPREKLEDRISELQCQTFEVDSKKTERKARQLFAEIDAVRDGADYSDEIDELRDELRQLQSGLESARSDLLEQVSDIRFLLNGTISQSRRDDVHFARDREAPNEE